MFMLQEERSMRILLQEEGGMTPPMGRTRILLQEEGVILVQREGVATMLHGEEVKERALAVLLHEKEVAMLLEEGVLRVPPEDPLAAEDLTALLAVPQTLTDGPDTVLPAPRSPVERVLPNPDGRNPVGRVQTDAVREVPQAQTQSVLPLREALPETLGSHGLDNSTRDQSIPLYFYSTDQSTLICFVSSLLHATSINHGKNVYLII